MYYYYFLWEKRKINSYMLKLQKSGNQVLCKFYEDVGFSISEETCAYAYENKSYANSGL